MIINEEYLDHFIEGALREDVGTGDHSSLACIPPQKSGKASLLIKQDGILAGMDVAFRVFKKLESGIGFTPLLQDGSKIKAGDQAFQVEGKVLTLLKAERLVLNVMQRMSGIATETQKYVKELEGLHTRILDTRKTTPGMRMLEKAAVKIGGGTNHRMGLYDMIMLKDNHIAFAGGVEKAIDATQEYLEKNHLDLRVEIEAQSFDDIERILNHGGINMLLLDNFSAGDMHKAVQMIGGRYQTEASGGITLATIRDYALSGVDFISVGALTHQIKSLDMSLKATF